MRPATLHPGTAHERSVKPFFLLMSDKEIQPRTISLWNAGRFALVAALTLAVASTFITDNIYLQPYVQRLTSLLRPSTSSFLDNYVCKHDYSVEVVNRFPLVLRINNFMQPGESEHMMALATPRLAPSTVVDEEDGKETYKLDTEYRTSYTAWLDKYQDPVARCVEERAAQFAPVDPMHAESLQVLRYGPKQKYTYHYDYYPREMLQDAFWGQYGQRYSTVLVYLNDVEEGGHTDFPRLGLSFKPQKNMALFWYNVDLDDKEDPTSLHAGMPVVKGVKWAINISQRRWLPGLAPWHGWRHEPLKEGEVDSLDKYDIPEFAKPYITSVQGTKLEQPEEEAEEEGYEIKADSGHDAPPIPLRNV